MHKITQYLKDSVTFYLATVEGDQPRVRPFGAVCEFEDKIYLITANTKDVYRQIIANPKVEISAMVEGSWIRLTGELVRDERREARQAMPDAAPSLNDLYQVDDGKIEVFYFTKGQAAFCSFTDAPEVVNI